MAQSKTIQQQMLSIGRKFGILAGVAAISCGVTYIVCQQNYEAVVAELQEQISDLKKKELQAKVTQRVSEQMEDIAFQQKNISDKQREEAVKQSRIADMERGKAEIERGLAQQAQMQAVEAAQQADQMRIIAENQTELATNNMMDAEEARAKADTLFYLSMGNSLAQSALAKGNVATDISRLLSYASWHYTKQFGGDENSDNVYKALLYSSNSIEQVNTTLKGNVRSIEIINIDGAKWTLGITDYGEIILCNDARQHHLFNVENAAFRGMSMMSDNHCAAITSDGQVVVMEFRGARNPQMKVLGTIRLGSGVWRDICYIGKNILVVMSDRSLVWVNGQSMGVKTVSKLNTGLQTLGYESDSGILHLFGANGLHYTASAANSGRCQRSDLTTVKEKITAYFYNKSNGSHLLGTESGTIYIIDKQGRIMNTMSGHAGAITSIKAFNQAIVSTSYDHTMRFWSFASLTSIAESIEFRFEAWPLSFVIDNDSQMIWIGNEAGKVNRFCISASKNALATQALLRREFTQDEWNYYIGKSVPYRTFKKTHPLTPPIKGGE